MTETHKIAGILSGKTIGSFAVASQKDGWIDSSGKTIEVSASPKKVRFFDSVEVAKANGFSPSEVQKVALASWKVPAITEKAPAK